jgi:signal peptidase II|tara:strand:- start:460 stop:966 length:507 start_codon:yes stop_codon:yes gene_type:complete
MQMKLKNKKKFIYSSLIITIIFFLDRISKIYIISLEKINGSVDLFVTKYLNIYLIWNEGIAFGLLSFEHKSTYAIITGLIVIITLVVLTLIIKTNDIRFYFYSFVFGGALGNLIDRLYYSAVPDFIDMHINNYHWFIFNVADIFITIGVFCLILVELIFNKSLDNEKK